MNNIPIIGNPDVQNQLWALVALGVSWLLGQAYSWVKGQLSDNQSALITKVEHYAEIAAAWAMVHFPGLSPQDLATKAEDKLRDILRTQGIDIPDVIWVHLTQVVEGFIVKQLAARHPIVSDKGITTSPGGQVAVSGTLPKVVP